MDNNYDYYTDIPLFNKTVLKAEQCYLGYQNWFGFPWENPLMILFERYPKEIHSYLKKNIQCQS